MNYYDPWSHAIQLFFIRLLQFFLVTLLLGLLWWYMLLHNLGYDLLDATRQAITGDNLGLRVILALCLALGASLTGWLFTYVAMRWPARNRGADRHRRGARVIMRDE